MHPLATAPPDLECLPVATASYSDRAGLVTEGEAAQPRPRFRLLDSADATSVWLAVKRSSRRERRGQATWPLRRPSSPAPHARVERPVGQVLSAVTRPGKPG